jgi:hypothetical protein
MRFAYLMRTGLALLIASSTFAESAARAQVEPRPTREGQKYSVRIDSAPQQAAIYLDDERYGIVGYTPWAGKLERGSWKLILKKDGYQVATRIITVNRSSRPQETFLPMTRTAPSPVVEVKEGEPAPAGGSIPVEAAAPDPVDGGMHATQPGASAGGQDEEPAASSSVGGLRFVSTPGGATVVLDGEPIGQTPMVKEDVAVGEHSVSIQQDGFYPYENNVVVVAGQTKLISATLQEQNIELTDEQKAELQRSLTTFGARALPAGRSTMAFGAGYPYLMSARFMVGVGKISEQIQFDAGASFRTYGRRWDLSLIGRATFIDTGPFALGAFTDFGGGSTYFDNSKRDYFFFNGGLNASLTGLGAATLTGRAYLNAWTDRHCPRLEGGGFEVEDTDAPDICLEYLNGSIDPDVKRRIDRMLGGDGEIFNRDAGVRAIVSIAIEVALAQRWSLWGLFEGVPRQEQRAAFTDYFHSIWFEQDARSYFQIGLTAKF